MLKGAIAEEKAKRGFDKFPSEPLAMYYPQRFCPGAVRRVSQRLAHRFDLIVTLT